MDIEVWLQSVIQQAEELGQNTAEISVYELKEIYEQFCKLKTQKKTFIVIDAKTGKEADPHKIAGEDWVKKVMSKETDGFALKDDGAILLLDNNGRLEYCDSERFTIQWEEAKELKEGKTNDI